MIDGVKRGCSVTRGVFDTAKFSTVALMVMVTTFMAPPLLMKLFPPAGPQHENEIDAIEEVIVDA
jgi:hypothetical protein